MQNNKKQKTLKIKSKSEMTKLAKDLGNKAQKGDIFLLKGSLGVGKTFFVKAFIKYFLDKNEEIPSPTFNILKVYKTKKMKLYHLDLYRIKKEEELYELGIEDALEDGVCLIEWPELAYNFISNRNYYEIEIKMDAKSKNKEFRIVKIK
ncbi:tRNA (adenosine(37)-N6)-threonylcarbamoyltransferase complex ATPase subunit type 1 TsaE [Pseudomonadota bacterium]